MFVHSLLVWATQSIFQSPSIEFNPMTTAFECHSTLYLALWWELSQPQGCLTLGMPVFSECHCSGGHPGYHGQIHQQFFLLRQVPVERGSFQKQGDQRSLSAWRPAYPPCWNWDPDSQIGSEQNERKGSVRIVQECETELKENQFTKTNIQWEIIGKLCLKSKI